MRINMINGSQKTGKSNTGIILKYLNYFLKNKSNVKIFNCGNKPFPDETFREIVSADVIILAFPLFVYSMPSNTLEMLIKLESVIKQEKAGNLIIYTIINNGFYEGKQNNIAFEIINNWCGRSGVKFGGGIGQGAGEMLGRVNIPLDKGPFKNLYKNLQKLAETVLLKKTFGIVFLNPFFPRFLWKIMAVRFWKTKAKNNGLSKKDISRIVEY